MAGKRLYLGRTTWRQKHQLFGTTAPERRLHTYIVGKTGTGKSSLIATLALQDALDGRGFALVDPHGDLSDLVASFMERRGRSTRVVVATISDATSPVTFNPLENVALHRDTLLAANSRPRTSGDCYLSRRPQRLLAASFLVVA